LQDHFVARSHMWDQKSPNSCANKDFSAFLFIVRNPLQRLTSWYFYEHPRKFPYSRYVGAESECPRQFHKLEGNELFANGCFSSLEEFALHVIPPTNDNKHQSDCQKLAWDVATGKQRCAYHNAFGYSYYLRRSQELSELHPKKYHNLVIRTEHLAEDWDQLDRAYGGTMEVNGTVRFARPPASQNQTIHSSSDSKELKRLSDTGRNNLCRALCYEIQVFKTIINMSENLNERQKRESIQEVVASCPDETLEIRKCPSPVHLVCPKQGGYKWANQST
jgi:hypothetical protein